MRQCCCVSLKADGCNRTTCDLGVAVCFMCISVLVSSIVNKRGKIKELPTQAVFEPAHSKIEVQQGTTGVQSAATELEVIGCSSESPTKATYKRKVAELGDIIAEKEQSYGHSL
ncbi:hypothetical protein AVEN_10815-1 [Araneus ventricosus]|uniref:Uncharacterized protein n=1 Tax=Araneus ventricosus TaxID=182803 RepID=A0A4Y2QJM0_ARAVE|nr:hypothetical protein AVEN_10815-1 [Araneus ventricosus]